MQDPEVEAVLAAQRNQLRQIHQQHGTLKAGLVKLSLSQWLTMLRTTGKSQSCMVFLRAMLRCCEPQG